MNFADEIDKDYSKKLLSDVNKLHQMQEFSDVTLIAGLNGERYSTQQ